MKNLQIARKSLIYTDSTGADKVAPAEKNSTDVSAAFFPSLASDHRRKQILIQRSSRGQLIGNLLKLVDD